MASESIFVPTTSQGDVMDEVFASFGEAAEFARTFLLGDEKPLMIFIDERYELHAGTIARWVLAGTKSGHRYPTADLMPKAPQGEDHG